MADSPDADSPSNRPSSTDVLTVEELNQRIATAVDDATGLNSVRCIGEVTDYGRSDTAVYFTLTDGDAELQCMIWASRYRSMDVELEDGVEVVLEGDVDFWVEGGRLDLKPWAITVVGDGDQAAAVERLRAELDERGWFDDGHKEPPPLFPERVGVVTSLQGDARYDIQNAILGRDPSVDILVCDATVQGADAPTSIANAIHHLDRSRVVDVLIVGRGGGSDTDLQAFDTEQVAEAIFPANMPVVTAVGHTEDRTTADRVADRAAITPTGASESVVESPAEFIAGTVEPLEQELEAASRAFERELEHGAELERAVEHAASPEGLSPAYYKVAIAVLVVLLLVITPPLPGGDLRWREIRPS